MVVCLLRPQKVVGGEIVYTYSTVQLDENTFQKHTGKSKHLTKTTTDKSTPGMAIEIYGRRSMGVYIYIYRWGDRAEIRTFCTICMHNP